MKAYEPIDSDAVRLRNKFTFVSPSLCHNLNEMLSKISDCNCLKKQSIDSCCEDVFSFNVDLLVWVSNRFDTFRCRFFSYFGHLNKVRKVNIGFIMFTEWTVFVWTSLWELDGLRVKRENGKKPARNRRSTTIYSDRAMCVCVCIFTRHPIHLSEILWGLWQKSISCSFVFWLFLFLTLSFTTQTNARLFFVLSHPILVSKKVISRSHVKCSLSVRIHVVSPWNDFRPFELLLIFPF